MTILSVRNLRKSFGGVQAVANVSFDVEAGQMLALSNPIEPFKPYFFVGRPNNPDLGSAYHAAVEILKLSPVSPEVIEETEIDRLVRQIEAELHDSVA